MEDSQRREKKLQYLKKWQEEHRDRCHELSRRWYENNKEKAKMLAKERYKEKKEKIIKAVENWRKNNPEKSLSYRRKSSKKRRDTLKGNLNSKISCLIYQSLRKNKNGRKWENIVGFSLQQLKIHLEKQFTNGMNWEKFMKGEIHIDHKIPLNVFNFEKSDDIDFKKCWSLKNLQPLWRRDNIRKSDNLEKPFQPSLIL